jgi:cyclopropane fatty-acyl-phospholipid synthase-like methyltransferase
VREVLDRLSPGNRVIDLGCGPGDPATRLLSERHFVLGVDLSRTQLGIAKRFAPRAALVQADVTEFHCAANSVDAVVSFYMTGHLPAAEHGSLYVEIATWLRPGGLLLTSAPLTADEGSVENWLGLPMFFGGIGAEATVGAIQDAGLVVEGAELVEEVLDEGGVERFLWVTARQPT